MDILNEKKKCTVLCVSTRINAISTMFDFNGSNLGRVPGYHYHF